MNFEVHIRFLQVFVDTFAGWVEELPPPTKGSDSLQPPLEDHSPLWNFCLSPVGQWPQIHPPHFPNSIQSPQHLLPFPYSILLWVRVRTNCSLRNTLVQLSQELHLSWVKLLLLWSFSGYVLSPSDLLCRWLALIHLTQTLASPWLTHSVTVISVPSYGTFLTTTYHSQLLFMPSFSLFPLDQQPLSLSLKARDLPC